MGNTAEIIEANKNKAQSVGGTLASMGLEKTGAKIGAKTAGKVAGYIVTPAIWAYNYGTSGSTPDAIDLSLYGLGFLGSFAGVAAIGTGIVKAFVDDDIAQKLEQIKAKENPKYAKFIQACAKYGFASPAINAMTIASKGGTAWKHPNGLWVYITDIRGFMVHDFQPNVFTQIYRPKHPLVKSRDGRLMWEMITK